MDPLLIEIPLPIETPRLRLDTTHEGMGPVVNAAIRASQGTLKPWMPWAQEMPTVDETEANLRASMAKLRNRTDLRLHIWLKDGTYVGGTGLHQPDWDVRKFEIGYWVGTAFEGKGYCTETVRALTVYAADQLNARRVEIRCDEKNFASKRVMEKAGFVQEGHFRNDSLDVDGVTPRSTLVYAMTDFSGLDRRGISWPAASGSR